jgi:hypothetical protein
MGTFLVSILIHKAETASAPLMMRFLLGGVFLPAAYVIFGTLLAACVLSSSATAISACVVTGGRHPLYCRAVALLNLLYFPFGTALGVITLRALARGQGTR